MILQKIFFRIKRFIMRVLILFLPRPASAPEGTEVVTEMGVRKIIRKLFLYLVIGMWLANILSVLRHIGVLQSYEFHTALGNLSDPVINLSLPEALLFCLTLIYYGIMPILRYMYKWLRVTGIIYAVSSGFILSCGMGLIKLNMIGIILLSITLTAILTLLPLYIMKYRHIQLPPYLSCITYVSFAVITLGGSVLNTLNMIPYICNLTGFLLKLSNKVEIIIILDTIKVTISFLFMFLAYNRATDYAKRKVSRKYEWLVAFTGFYTVLLIIVKIFEMLVFIVA